MTTSNDQADFPTGLSFHVGPVSAGHSVPVTSEILNGLGLKHEVDQDGLMLLLDGPTGSGKTNAIKHHVELIQRQAAAFALFKTYLNPLLERALEREADLILTTGQRPQLRKNMYSPNVIEAPADPVVTNEDIDALAHAFIFLSEFAIDLRYVYKEQPFGVSIRSRKEQNVQELTFHRLSGIDPRKDEAVRIQGNGLTTVYGDL